MAMAAILVILSGPFEQTQPIEVDRLAKATFSSRYAHTPFVSAPVPILFNKKVIAIFVMRLHHHVIIM